MHVCVRECDTILSLYIQNITNIVIHRRCTYIHTHTERERDKGHMRERVLEQRCHKTKSSFFASRRVVLDGFGTFVDSDDDGCSSIVYEEEEEEFLPCAPPSKSLVA